MTIYRQGGYYERRTMTAFRHDGYWCWQTRGSKGAADLVCAKPGQLVLVQVKSGAKPISGEGWNDLHALAYRLGAVPVVAEWTARRPDERGQGLIMRLRQITGPHPKRSHRWPSTVFHLDEVEAAVARHPSSRRLE